MSIQDLISGLYQRVDDFLDRDDVAAVMDEQALAEAAELEDANDEDDEPDLAVPAAVGWLFWCRFLAMDRGPHMAPLAMALDRFLPVREHYPESLPEILLAALELIDS